MNQPLQQLHKLLLAQHNALAEKLDEADNAADARAIITEMREILHRIDLTQNLLFRESSKALEKSLEKIEEASDDLNSALRTAKKAGEFVDAVGGFLKLVDKAIDIAKTLASLAV